MTSRVPSALVVVESPTKARQLQALLGPSHRVVATAGHLRDLPRAGLGIDTATMEPKYETPKNRTGVVGKLRSTAKNADVILLATDPDREGEAIAQHVAELLQRRCERVSFTELTEAAVGDAIKSSREIDLGLVHAQQARRVLDRLVGYMISPLLWELDRGLSAGRVQSAALHLLCGRERERMAFVSSHHFEIVVTYSNGFRAVLADGAEDGKLTARKFSEATKARQLADSLAQESAHTVSDVETIDHEIVAPAPLTTSTMLQAASGVLGLTSETTMSLAQALFEAGLITFVRSETCTLSAQAVVMARDYFEVRHSDLLAKRAPDYGSETGPKESHEAIRPTSLDEAIASNAVPDACRPLWKLIRTRFLASQCVPAQVRIQEVALRAGENRLVARSRRLISRGFLELLEDRDAEAWELTPCNGAELNTLAEARKGDVLTTVRAIAKRHKTQPPERYTEASIIAEMERLQIGRPSTYATIVGTLRRRNYIEDFDNSIIPTELGLRVDELVSAGFPDIVGADFTRICEMRLDEIARCIIPWRDFCSAFYRRLSRDVERASPRIQEASRRARSDLIGGYDGMPCPRCGGGPLEARLRAKTWLKCPDGSCGALFSVRELREAEHVKCPKCGGRTSLHDRGFFGCIRYPTCDGTVLVDQIEKARLRPVSRAETATR